METKLNGLTEVDLYSFKNKTFVCSLEVMCNSVMLVGHWLPVNNNNKLCKLETDISSVI